MAMTWPTDPGPSVLSAAGIEADPETMTVSRGLRRVHLSPVEFRLLAALLARPDQLVTRDELLAAVWGHDSTVDPRTVDVVIGRVRRALAMPLMRHSTIRTVRHRGYMLISR